MKVIIDADQLSKHYATDGKIKAVDELDLQVDEGATFGPLDPMARARRRPSAS